MKRAWTRAFACLALVAMLLLVAMPVVGRSFGGGFSLPGEAAHAAHSMAMADMAAMTPAEHAAHMRLMAAARSSSGAARPGRSPHEGHAGHDCAYCPLLSALHASPGVPVLNLGPAALAPWSVAAVARRPVAAPVPALGGQGPPPFVLRG